MEDGFHGVQEFDSFVAMGYFVSFHGDAGVALESDAKGRIEMFAELGIR